MKSEISKAVAKAAITVAAALASGALAYANKDNPEGAVILIGITAVLMGFLAFCSAAE